MRTLNFTKPIGYNLVMAEIRNADFNDPAGTGRQWLNALAEVSFIEFGEPLPGYTPAPHLRIADRETLSGHAAHTLLTLLDSAGVSAGDLFDAAYTTVRYLSMRQHFMEGTR